MMLVCFCSEWQVKISHESSWNKSLDFWNGVTAQTANCLINVFLKLLSMLIHIVAFNYCAKAFTWQVAAQAVEQNSAPGYMRAAVTVCGVGTLVPQALPMDLLTVETLNLVSCLEFLRYCLNVRQQSRVVTEYWDYIVFYFLSAESDPQVLVF